MKRYIKILIPILLIIIVILGTILLFTSQKKSQNSQLKKINHINGISNNNDKANITLDNIELKDYFDVSNCISAYLSNINQNSPRYYGRNENNEYVLIVNQEQINKCAYDLLSNEYIEKNSVSLDNVYKYVPEVKEQLLFVPIDIKSLKESEINIFKVHGFVLDIHDNYKGDLYTIVNLDRQNNTYSIEPTNVYIFDSDVIDSNITKIDPNDYNSFKPIEQTDEYTIKQFFNNYKHMLLSNTEIAYKFLNEDYKQEAFSNIDNFKKYIEQNKERIKSATISGYKLNTYDDYLEYIEKDQNGNYYLLTLPKNNVSQFNMMLDTYILGSTETRKEYEKSKNEKKVTFNALKFIYAINDKNYSYIYSKLDSDFINNNFASEEIFEDYIKNSFFEKNEPLSESTVKNENDYYIYETQIRNGNNFRELKVNVIMKLEDGIGYKMSFSIE